MHTLNLSLYECPLAILAINSNLQQAKKQLLDYMKQQSLIGLISPWRNASEYTLSDSLAPILREELPPELSISSRVNLIHGMILSRFHFQLSAYQCIFQRYKRTNAKVLEKGHTMNTRL